VNSDYRNRFAIRSTFSASARCSLADVSNIAFDDTNFPSLALVSSTPAASRQPPAASRQPQRAGDVDQVLEGQLFLRHV
jgi:hypothetical protein